LNHQKSTAKALRNSPLSPQLPSGTPGELNDKKWGKESIVARVYIEISFGGRGVMDARG